MSTSVSQTSPVVAIDTAGDGYTRSDGVIFAADTATAPHAGFVGTAGTVTSPVPIANSDDDLLYQSYRYGKDFGYAIALADGTYTVEFQFVETYWTAAGKRVFDLHLEGSEVASNVDIFAAAGKGNVYSLSRTVTVTDGRLDIRLEASGTDDRDNASLSALVIRPVASPPPPANAAPVNTVPGAQTAQAEQAVAIKGVAVSDADSASLTTSLSVDRGNLSLVAASDVVVTGNGTGSITLTGTAAAINASLASLTYTGGAGYTGADALAVSTSDGELQDSDSVTINVVAPSASDTASFATATTGVYANLTTDIATPLLRIMPFGDSITYGVVSATNTESGGYRLPLWNQLAASDLALDFVGSLSNGPSTFPDRNHQGLRGKTIDYLNTYDATYLSAAKPDAVLLMIGTNDLGSSTVSAMIADLKALIVSITNNQPNATVFVSTIPPTHNATRNAIATAYNEAIPGLVEELNATRKVVFVDMRDLTLSDVTAPPADSGVHPTLAGYEKIAANWHEALLSSGLFDALPEALGGVQNLVGSAYGDKLVGDAGANTLDGGAGADQLLGGAGDDVYIVDNVGDVVTEAAGEGADTIRTGLSKYALAAGSHVETLIYTGTAAATLTGNGFANRLEGGAGNDTLNGGAGADMLIGGMGNDTYYVDDVGDILVEPYSGGTDTVRATVSYTLSDNVNHLTLEGTADLAGTGNDYANTLTGNGGSNALYGLGGNDTLKGGLGADQLAGGAGNDIYYVDDAGDAVVELSGGGTDLVYSTIDHALASWVEQLTLSGTGSINGTGNTLANTLTGNVGANRLAGGDGNDTLYGKAGADRLEGDAGNDTLQGGTGTDTLVGGTGNDRFDWDSAADAGLGATRDLVLDFVRGEDRIDLSGIDAKTGTTTNDAFSFIGAGAFTGVAGQLRYQADSSGAGGLLIQGDTNGDAAADFEIKLDGSLDSLQASHFVL